MKKILSFVALAGLMTGATSCKKLCQECDCTRVTTVTTVLLAGTTTSDVTNTSHTFTACSDFDNAANDLEYWQSNPTITDVSDITQPDPVTGEDVKIGTATSTQTNDCSCEG